MTSKNPRLSLFRYESVPIGARFRYFGDWFFRHDDSTSAWVIDPNEPTGTPIRFKKEFAKDTYVGVLPETVESV